MWQLDRGHQHPWVVTFEMIDTNKSSTAYVVIYELIT